MNLESLPLLIILAAGVIGHNHSVALAATFLLLVKLLGFSEWFTPLEKHGLNIGIIVLTIGILAPVASGKITLTHMAETFKSSTGLICLAAGVFVAWAGGLGLSLLKSSPELVSSLVIGTVAGVFFLKGVPVGPLIASGLVYLLLSLSKRFHS